MSLRFFSDHCVPTEIAETLRLRGHFVTLLRDVLPTASADPLVISTARERNEILLSLNGDFADIVAYPPADFPGILAIQLHNHPEIISQLTERLLGFLDLHPEQDFYRGKLLVVEVHRVRIRQ